MAQPKKLSAEEVLVAVEEWFTVHGIPVNITATKDRLGQGVVPLSSFTGTVFSDGTVVIGHNFEESKDVVSVVHALRQQYVALRTLELEREAADESKPQASTEEPPHILH